MATFNITTKTNIDNLNGKTGGDTYNINGAILNIDQDSRYGNTATTSASWAAVTISATLGGTINIDSTLVKLIPFRGGSGVVPAYNTVITQGANTGSGKLIGVYSSLTVAPTAPAAAMPATGYLKLKQVSGLYSNSGAFSGISANSNGLTVPGFIEIVGDRANSVTISRLGTFKVRGDWFQVGITTGNSANTYQIPTNGSLRYVPGVWVEKDVANTYEFYPNAGSVAATAAAAATDAIRGKMCWISTGGLVRFRNDGTNTTGGYLPPAGRKIRIPNIFFEQCASGARTVNVAPNATLATRYEFATSGAGVIDIDKANLTWWPNLLQPYSVCITNTGVFSQVLISECATALTLDNVGVGQEAATAQFGLSLALCFAGGTVRDCTWTSASLAASGRYIISITDIDDFQFINDKSFSFVARGNATTGNATITRMKNSSWANTYMGVGRHVLTGCSEMTYDDTVYWDRPITTTVSTNPMNVWELLTASSDNITISGLSFSGSLLQAYSGILNIATPCSNIKLRNIGTYESPLDLGDAQRVDQSWTRVTTTATVTSIAHGLKTGDIIYVLHSSSTGAISVSAKTITGAPTADTFTFAATNAAAASGVLTYYPTMGQYILRIGTGSAANAIKVQRCYVAHTRTDMYTMDNSSKNITFENCIGEFVLSAPVFTQLEGYNRGISGVPPMTASTSVYGTHWFDCFTHDIPLNSINQAWARTTTTASLSSNTHNLRTTPGSILVTSSSDESAITLGIKAVTSLSSANVNFTCLNAGAASGTLTYDPLASRQGLVMNEDTAITTSQVTIANGTPGFTSAGGLVANTINDTVVFTSPDYVIGHTGFPAAVPAMAGGTITNYDLSYAIDKNDGAGFSAYKNLSYPRAGGGGTNGSNNVTMTSTTGVNVGDYIWGTNINGMARVHSITDGTTIVSTKANIGTVSGILRFGHLPNETVNGFLGHKMKVRLRTSTASSTAITSLFWYTTSTDLSRSYQYPLDPVTVSVTAKSAADASVIQNAKILVEADTGGTLPAYSNTSSNCTITLSGNTATAVHFTPHGLSTGKYVIIRGANQSQYNKIAQITVANTTAYTFAVNGAPASPATGVVKATALVLTGNTNSLGVLTGTFDFVSNQPVKGTARKGTGTPFYKPAILTGTITSSGADITTFLVGDT